VQGRAEMLDRDSQKHIDARDVFLSRFPDAAPLFEFSDFNIVIIKPMSARVIAGFGQAITITDGDFSTTVGGRVKS
jgi:heme iron utilization protein